MLEIRNLSKAYRTKSGLKHQALKKITLQFGDRGFVFILGKSGCGKSTLLNILGGLDQADEGDFIIHGKTAEGFKASDWDSYRNTYLGFIFQEFNILDNYSVAKNIALALELQGHAKKEIKKEVERILKTVDLEDLGKRKTSELSGGQKQRVAIARALVKNPQIILADEPTGNLDKETGEQVFNILRKLAEDKLVLMVTHDKESAYKYADRIITMSDGEIVGDELNEGGLKYISDNIDIYRTDGEITKVLRVPKDKNVSLDELIQLREHSVKAGEIVYIPLSNALTKDDVDYINRQINHSADTRYLPIGKELHNIQGTSAIELKNRVNPQSNKEGWLKLKFQVIKSKLPVNNSFKMALSAIWRKKLKVVFSVILFLAALGLFGFSETITRFDYPLALANSYANGRVKLISISNLSSVEGWDQEETVPSPFPKEAYREMVKSFNGLSFGKINDFANSGFQVSNSSLLVYPKRINGVVEVKNIKDFGLEMITGRAPVKLNEIALTDYLADHLLSAENEYHNYQDLLDRPLNFNGTAYEVTGIMRTDYNDFLYLNDIPQSQYSIHTNAIGTFKHNEGALYTRFIVGEGFYDQYAKSVNAITRAFSYLIEKPNPQSRWDNQWLSDTLLMIDENIITHPLRDSFLYVPDGFSGLKQGEMIVDFTTLSNINFLDDDDSIKRLQEVDIQYDLYQTLLDEGKIPTTALDVFLFSEANLTKIQTIPLKVAGVINFHSYKIIRDADYMYDFVTEHGGSFSQEIMSYYYNDFNHYHYHVSLEYMRTMLAIKGIDVPTLSEYYAQDGDLGQKEDFMRYLRNLMSDNNLNKAEVLSDIWMPIIVNEETFQDLNPFRADLVQKVLVSLSDDKERNLEFFKYTEENNYRQETVSGRVLNIFNDFILGSSSVFRYISLGLAAFSVLLMFTNISTSIMYSKKEIGTLRAIGARGKDVATIFVTEAIIIAIFTAILANIALVIATAIINRNLSEQMGMSMILFNPSLLITLELIALSTLVMFLASYLPVKGVSLMKPIDAIKK